MESLDYNYFPAGPQPFQFLGYGADTGLLHAGGSNDVTGSSNVSEQTSLLEAFLTPCEEYG